MNRIIEDNIKLHDTSQFEIKISYPVNFKKRRSIYEVDVFLFSPYHLNINSKNYTKEDFYRQIKNYIRLKTPLFSLKEIIHHAKSPIFLLKESLKEDNLEKIEYHVKMLCSILKSTTRNYVRNLDLNQKKDRLKEDLNDFNDFVLKFTKIFRKLKKKFIDCQSYLFYCYADEFISLCLEAYSFELLEQLKTQSAAFQKKYIPIFIEFVEKERRHRKRMGFLSIPDPKTDNEIMIYRKSHLKKYALSILFLSTLIKESGKILKQMSFGLAAALAMIFATLVAVFSSKYYGPLTLPFVTIVVIAYIFKDRIKDVVKHFFANKVLRDYVSDHKLKIYDSKNKKIGIFREQFQFISSQKLPQKIKKIRNSDPFAKVTYSKVKEVIFYYSKKVRISSKRVAKSLKDYEFKAIDDIFRLNFDFIMRKCDDSNKKLIYPVNENKYEMVKGKKYYYFFLVLRYKNGNEEEYKSYRLTLGRKGIKRLEPYEVNQ